MQYVIGGQKYSQSPLVLGQWRQLFEAMKGLTIPGEANAIELIGILGDRISEALAIVLNPDGVPLKEKDLTAIAGEIEFGIEGEVLIQVIEDFFVCNPLPLILQKINAAAGIMAEMMTEKTPLTPSLSPSPAETSPSGTASSGDLPSANAGRG